MAMFEQFRAAKEAVEFSTSPKEKYRLRAKLAALALLGIAIPANAYWQDVKVHQEIQAAASIDIDAQLDPLDPDNNDSAIIAMDGFGTYDADNLVEHLGPVAQELNDGQVWSVSYGNAPLEPSAITNRIIEMAKERGVTNVSILGYSAGGVIGTKVTEQLVLNSPLDVEMLMGVSTPDGPEGLRDAQVQEIDIANFINEIPGATYSSFVRFLGELYFRREKLMEDPLGTIKAVWEALGDEQLPGTWLLIDQVNAITDSDIAESIENIANAPADKKRPVIVYLGTAKPGYDYMVDDDLSGYNFWLYASENGLEIFRSDVPGAIHTRPDQANEAYHATADKLAPYVATADEREEDRLRDARYEAAHIPKNS